MSFSFTITPALVAATLVAAGCRAPASSPTPGDSESGHIGDDGGLGDGGVPCAGGNAGFDNEHSPHRGGDISQEVIVDVYSDFRCPSCAVFQALAHSLWQDPLYRDRVRLYFHHFVVHPSATEIHQAAEAVFRQDPDGFWILYDEIYTRLREDLEIMTLEDVLTFAETHLDVDPDRLETDRRAAAINERIEQDKAFGKTLGVSGTPSIFVCGERIDSMTDLSDTVSGLLE